MFVSQYQLHWGDSVSDVWGSVDSSDVNSVWNSADTGHVLVSTAERTVRENIQLSVRDQLRIHTRGAFTHTLFGLDPLTSQFSPNQNNRCERCIRPHSRPTEQSLVQIKNWAMIQFVCSVKKQFFGGYIRFVDQLQKKKKKCLTGLYRY